MLWLFQSTYLYKVRRNLPIHAAFHESFNPRTYIRYDKSFAVFFDFSFLFQSTYLYKVRQFSNTVLDHENTFQSTYLYKVRLITNMIKFRIKGFNPRTYIRYDLRVLIIRLLRPVFQSTYLYKVRLNACILLFLSIRFQSTYLYKVRRLPSPTS